MKINIGRLTVARDLRKALHVDLQGHVGLEKKDITDENPEEGE